MLLLRSAAAPPATGSFSGDGGSTSGSTSGSSGSGGFPPPSSMSKARADELLSGVLYRRAQQMRQNNVGTADPPPSSPPYQSATAPPPPPSPSQQQQGYGSNGSNSSSNGSVPNRVTYQVLAPSSRPLAPGGSSSVGGDASDREWQLDAAASSREAAEALAAYVCAISHHQPVSVHFCLRLRAQAGQRVKVVGACEQLGSWNMAAAPELRWKEGDTWHASVELPAGSVTEYKYVLLDAAGTRIMAWQDGNNSLLAVRLGEGAVGGGLSVLDDWYAGPGSKVAVGTGAPAARDHRLQTWAGDLYAQLMTQRQDLRRLGVELAGAWQEATAARLQAQQALTQLREREAAAVVALEETRIAMLELERVRGQLVERELEHAWAVCGYTEAKTMNDVLQAQLTDTTATLHEAIELLSLKAAEEDRQAPSPAAAAAIAVTRAPRKRRTSHKAAAAEAAVSAAAEAAVLEAASGQQQKEEDPAVKPSRARRSRPSKAASAAIAVIDEEVDAAVAAADAEPVDASKVPRTQRARNKAAAKPAHEAEAVAPAAETPEQNDDVHPGSLVRPAQIRRAHSKAAESAGEQAQMPTEGVAPAKAARTRQRRSTAAAADSSSS